MLWLWCLGVKQFTLMAGSSPFPPELQPPLFYCPWPSDVPGFICGTPQWYIISMYSQMWPACSSSCPMLSGSCLCTLPGIIGLFTDPQRILLWGWRVAHTAEFATEMFPPESKTSLCSQGFFLSVFKAPLPRDVFLHSQYYLKDAWGQSGGLVD